MSNTMTAHEPINYLDSILNEEEKRCEYSHQWRNFTISRSGRFKSKNKKRDVVDGKLFDSSGAATKPKDDNGRSGAVYMEQDKAVFRQPPSTSTRPSQQQSTTVASQRARDKTETYKSYYETNL